MRVPTPNVSLIDFVFNTKKGISISLINKAFRIAAKNKLKKIIFSTNEKLVSIDYNHSPFSAIIDESLTSTIGENTGKIVAWYDNEWGFSNRMCDIVQYIHKS